MLALCEENKGCGRCQQPIITRRVFVRRCLIPGEKGKRQCCHGSEPSRCSVIRQVPDSQKAVRLPRRTALHYVWIYAAESTRGGTNHPLIFHSHTTDFTSDTGTIVPGTACVVALLNTYRKGSTAQSRARSSLKNTAGNG